LEVKGVLKSWAIPKGPSDDPADKRLAIFVEDHPPEYRHFEGVIPEGAYGAGKVEIWDEGTYIPLGPKGEEIDEDGFLDDIKKGKITFSLSGKRMKGRFILVQMHSGEKNWLFRKMNHSLGVKTGFLLLLLASITALIVREPS
jgi:bifunctional non-homologous end joining protein LigD